MNTRVGRVCRAWVFLGLWIFLVGGSVFAADNVTLQVVDNYLNLENYWTKQERATVFSPGDAITGLLKLTAICSVWYPKVDLSFRIDRFGFSEDRYNESIDCDPNWVWSYGTSWKLPDDVAGHGEKLPFYFKAKVNNYPSNTVEKEVEFTFSLPTLLAVPAAFEPALQPSEPTGVKDYLKTYIINGRAAVKASVEQSAKLKGGVTGVGYHQKGEDFLAFLKTKRPYLVLLHARGAAGKIYFPDGGFIDSKKIADAQLPSPPGLFFAASSYSWYLRTSFCNYGSSGTYKAYVGFETSLYAKRAVDFYKYFFDQARTPGVSAKQALDAAKAWALNQEWWDVGYYSYIYGSGDSLFLGGPGAGSVSTGSELADPLPFTRWRPITAYELAPEERQAVALADRRPMVRKLKKAYGSRLVVGIEIYPTFYRVAYRLKQNGFLYGVDVDRGSGEMQFEGELK